MTARAAPLPEPPSRRLRVGGCVVDIDRREVDRADGAAPQRITLKAMQVLQVLAAQPGKVVSREQLLDTVWAGTMPTDDVLTQAATALRKALGDDRDAPQYIETIPKAGYRLLAAVEWLQDPTSAPVAHAAGALPAADPPASAARGRRWPLALAVTVAVALLLGWAWSKRQPVPPPASAPAAVAATGELPYTLLTSRPGPETQPALSPDGALVAYAMPASGPMDAPALFLQSSQPTPPRQITTPPAGHSDHLPRWSPDGRQLMFVRIDDHGGCELQLMPPSGGPARAVGRCDRLNGRYDWLPDGSGIVAGLQPAAEGDSAPLAVLRLDSGEWTPLRYPLGAGDVDSDPRYSPDGRQLAFRRNLSRADLWRMPAAGGTPERLTRLGANITGWDWAADGRSLLIGAVTGRAQLYRHDLASGTTVVLGDLSASGLDVAARGGRMVFAVDDARAAMFRFPLPADGGGSRAEPLFPSTGNDLLPSPSPDGRWLAFHSDRSRDARLWLGELAHPDRLRMVEGLRPVSRHPAQWSADGTRLLLVADADDAGDGEPPRLYEVDVASGRARSLALDGVPYQAQYLPGGRLLVVVDRGAGRLALQLLGPQGDGWKVALQRDGIGEARYDPSSGQLWFVRASEPGLWRSGLDLADPVRVDAGRPAGHWQRRWSLLDGRPFALRSRGEACLSAWQWLGTGQLDDGACLDRGRRGVPSQALVVSADGRWLYAGMYEGMESSDIGMLDLAVLARAATVAVSATR